MMSLPIWLPGPIFLPGDLPLKKGSASEGVESLHPGKSASRGKRGTDIIVATTKIGSMHSTGMHSCFYLFPIKSGLLLYLILSTNEMFYRCLSICSQVGGTYCSLPSGTIPLFSRNCRCKKYPSYWNAFLLLKTFTASLYSLEKHFHFDNWGFFLCEIKLLLWNLAIVSNGK